MKVKAALKNVSRVVEKASPAILTVIASGGVITSVVMAIKVTPTAMGLIDDEVYNRYEANQLLEGGAEKTYGEWLGKDINDGYEFNDRLAMLSAKDIFRLCWRTYLPVAGVVFASIGCIVGAQVINGRRLAALASAYGLADAAFKEYKDKVVETIGAGKELGIRDAIAADKVKENPPDPDQVIWTGFGEVLCYDAWSGRYFRSNMESVRKAVNDINFALRHENWMSLNEFYCELGIGENGCGNQSGWDIERGQLEVSYTTTLSDKGEPCIVLTYKTEPRYGRN